MAMTLTHTTRDKIDGKHYTIYRLFEEGKLIGECCISGDHTFIKYDTVTIEIQNRAPWYRKEDIWFVEQGTGSEVGHFSAPDYYDHPYWFAFKEEEWQVRNLTGKEIDALAALRWWGGKLISSGDDKLIHCTFSHPPPQGSLWGTYMERVGKLDAKGDYLPQILLSCFVMEKMEADRQRD